MCTHADRFRHAEENLDCISIKILVYNNIYNMICIFVAGSMGSDACGDQLLFCDYWMKGEVVKYWIRFIVLLFQRRTHNADWRVEMILLKSKLVWLNISMITKTMKFKGVIIAPVICYLYFVNSEYI